MKKKYFIFIVTMLVIGFAAVATNLIVKGIAKISFNKEDFQVIFTAAIPEDGGSAEISDDKKSISYTSKDLINIGDEASLDYTITNNSRNYDAQVNVLITDEMGESVSSEYFLLSDTIKPNEIVPSMSSTSGRIVIKMVKPTIDNYEKKFIVTIKSNPIERDSLAEGEPKEDYFLGVSYGDDTGITEFKFNDETLEKVDNEQYNYYDEITIDKEVNNIPVELNTVNTKAAINIEKLANIDDESGQLITGKTLPINDGYNYYKFTIISANEKKENVIILCIKIIKEYTITYNLNGGHADNKSSYNYFTDTFKLTNPERLGYKFLGWTGTDEGDNITINQGSTGDKEYTANWEIINYSITITYNGGSATNPTSYNVETPTFTLANPTKTGYNFTGWSGDVTGKTVTINQGTVGNKSYTANYSIKSYTVTNSVVKGSVGSDSLSIEYGGTKTLKVTPNTGYYLQSGSCTNGYTITNMNTGTSNTAAQTVTIKNNSKDSDSTCTFTNKARTFTLTYNVNGGAALSTTTKTITYDATYGTLATPTRTGYNFVGWYTAATGGSKIETTTKVTVLANQTIYAHWSKTTITKGDPVHDFGSTKDWIVYSVSGTNVVIFSKNPVGSWTETSEAPATEISRINTAAQSYSPKNSGGTVRATASNMTLSQIASYIGTSLALNSTITNTLFNTGNYWTGQNCTEKYGGPYYVSGGLVRYAYYSDAYVDTFSLRPIATISSANLSWNVDNKYWEVK